MKILQPVRFPPCSRPPLCCFPSAPPRRYRARAGPDAGRRAGAGAAAAACPAVLKHTFKRLQDEAPQDLCQYAGKVVLVVNTASYCGFTKQYDGLEKLYAKYAPRGLVVLGFPSNDFKQEERTPRRSPTSATTPTA